MQCSSPTWLRDQEMFVPCGKCVMCKIAKARDWAVRIIHESDYHNESLFVTLTYDEDNVPINGSVSKDELQRFLKRYRKQVHPRKVRYYACGEYGDRSGRPHYHLILFSASYDDFTRCYNYGDVFYRSNSWSKGHVYLGTVTYESARYVADYVQKVYYGDLAKEVYDDYGLAQPFQLYSKGLGRDYVKDNKEYLLQKYGLTIKGKEVGLNRYYKSKLDISGEAYYNHVKDRLAKKANERIEAEKRRLVLRNKLGIQTRECRAKMTLSAQAQRVKNANARNAMRRNKG